MIHHRVDQNSGEWENVRCGIPTGSRASDLVTSSGESSKSLPRYAEELAMDVYAGKPLEKFAGNWATQRGHEMEPIAAAWYAFERDADVQKCGFFTDDLGRYGASPDRTVGDVGLLEIKCQDNKGHLKTLLAYHKNPKPPAAYYSQAQMELMTSEKKWLDMVLYHPELPCTIIRILPDIEFHKKLKLQITACIAARDAIVQQLQEIAA